MLGGESADDRGYQISFRASSCRRNLDEHELTSRALMLFATRCALRMWDLVGPSSRALSAASKNRRLYEAVRESIDVAVEVCRAANASERQVWKTRAQALVQRLAAFNLDNPEGTEGLSPVEIDLGIAAECLALCITNYYSPRGASLADNAVKVAAHGEWAVRSLSDREGSHLTQANRADARNPELSRIEAPADPGGQGPLGPLWPEEFRRTVGNDQSPEECLQPLNERLDELHQPVIEEFQKILIGRLAGRSFGSFEFNQAVVTAIQQLLDRLGMRVKCPKCGEPARLRCVAPPRMPQGCFQLEHYTEGRLTRHGAYATLPRLELVQAPPEADRRRRSARATPTESKD